MYFCENRIVPSIERVVIPFRTKPTQPTFKTEPIMQKNDNSTKSSDTKKSKLVSTISKPQSICLTSTYTSDPFFVFPSTSIPNVVNKTSKSYLYPFLENLFKINMSHDNLVDIIISDNPSGNPPDDNLPNNQIIIVGRPEMLGSSMKQMRHITPYAFIEHAIKGIIQQSAGEDGYKSYIRNIVEAIKPLIQSKAGICLTHVQYQQLLSDANLQTVDIPEIFTFKTVTREQQQNEYHLIY